MASLGLIDLSSIWWRNWHATKDLEVGEAAERTLTKVHQCASGHDYVAVCVDTKPYKRKEILPTYKAQRDAPETVALEQFDRVKTELERRYPVLGAEGYEADDVIATVVAGLEEDHVTIYSGDKDLMQLVDDKTQVISVATGAAFGPDQVHAKFGVWPFLMADYLALVGDSADNVPGVPKVGPKTAAKLLDEYEGFAAVFAAADEGKINGAVGDSLRTHVQSANQALALVTLMVDAPIDVDTIYREREAPVAEAETIEATEPEPVEAEPVEAEPEPARETRQAHQAIVVPKWELALEPVNSGGAVKLAERLYESRMFGQFPNPDAVLAVMLRGRALGLDAGTALSNFHVIEGKPAMNAQLLIGLVLRNEACEYLEWTESDAQHATWIAKRKGGKVEKRLTWTIEQACAAGLVTKDENGLNGFRGIPTRTGKPSNWDKHRDTMLRWRCGVTLARSVFPDIVAGLYTEDELREG